MGNVDFGFWALFRNLVGFNVSQSTSAQAGCSRVLGFGGKGVRCMLRALSLACLAGGAGFRPSTDSDSRSSPEALGEMGNVDFGFWALFRNLVGFNVSQST